MDELQEILDLLKDRQPQAEEISQKTLSKVNTLIDFCPVYRDTLRRVPELLLFLEEAQCARKMYRAGDFVLTRAYPLFTPLKNASDQELKASLRFFRRAMSLRIAYRELAGLSDIERSMKELSALAQYVLMESVEIVQKSLKARFGIPWDEDNNMPGSFCVIALGKMGSTELNFVSDLDLIYVHEGYGNCRKNDRATSTPNEVYFSKLARELTAMLQERGPEGFLYNIDLRLRPDGDSGPITCSLNAMERYYYDSGQTWERMALMKARPVAGDMVLGGELMETLSSFRFPRTPPPALFEEVAGLKLRIEHEVLGEENFRLNIKNGWGGIREIEFILQALQMTYQGRNPFLQTPSTLKAMEGLERYQVLGEEQIEFLRESYLWLRRVEHRLQMRHEEHTQTLPPPGTPARKELSESLGMSESEFETRMEALRARVREMYESYFPISSRENLIQEWIEFIAGAEPGQHINTMIDSVFWGPRETIIKGIRHLALGDAPVKIITRETAQLMIELSNSFPIALAPHAHPLRTLERVNEYADRYGARKRFLRLCAQNSRFFHALCMIFDRSSFIHKLVCVHPEILEELLLVSALRLNKPGRVMRSEIHALESDDDAKTAKALWLWIKAEQVRIAMAQVLSKVSIARVEMALSRVASVAVAEMLSGVDPEGELIVVALGKFGGREMSFGSDLDMMIVCREASNERMIKKALRLQKLLGYKGPLGAGFEVDMRLRPHGPDGPLVVALPALKKYHSGHGGQLWERQALLRSRPIADRSSQQDEREKIAEEYMQLRREILFGEGAEKDLFGEIISMRLRIEKEKAKIKPPERCFKAGPGGLLDIEFTVQALQLRYGGTMPELCSPNTREGLKALQAKGIISPEQYTKLAGHYEMLRTLEFRIRREHNSPASCIDENPDLEHSVAKWMSYKDFDSLMDDLKTNMKEARRLFLSLLDVNA